MKDTDGKVVGSENYRVDYFYNMDVGTAKVKVVFSGNYAGNETIEKTYYVQVRTYRTVSGKTYYSEWSKAVLLCTFWVFKKLELNHEMVVNGTRIG
ncbi:MAG: hypothetical protein J6A75_03950 [Lachnospiraceae bacterium]|nr:hypothetical protein [Lachnospiraceae bacterium]